MVGLDIVRTVRPSTHRSILPSSVDDKVSQSVWRTGPDVWYNILYTKAAWTNLLVHFEL